MAVISFEDASSLKQITCDLELIPNDHSIKLQSGTIGCEKHNRAYMLSFMQDNKFVDIMLTENQFEQLKHEIIKFK